MDRWRRPRRRPEAHRLTWDPRDYSPGAFFYWSLDGHAPYRKAAARCLTFLFFFFLFRFFIFQGRTVFFKTTFDKTSQTHATAPRVFLDKTARSDTVDGLRQRRSCIREIRRSVDR